jgi:hypothetical protein
MRLHHRPGVLPVRGGSDVEASTDPHRSAPYPPGIAALKTLFLFVDYALGWLVRIRPAVASGGWVIIERGWWDLVVDPLRYRLRPRARAARLLGRLLPRPDLTVILEASKDVLIARKDELPVEEIERQASEWRKVIPRRTSRRYFDGTTAPEETARTVLEQVGIIQARKDETSWMNLPRRSSPRWYLPREPRAVARASLSIHQPMTAGALGGWAFTDAVLRIGGAHLVPSGQAPPSRIFELMEEQMKTKSHLAVARVHEDKRYGCLAMDGSGQPLAFGKIDLGSGGRDRLNKEAGATARFAPLLPRPLSAPTVISRQDSIIVFEPVSWKARRRPWFLPPEVAAALGGFYAAREKGAERGPTHGDFAPWNLFRTPRGWTLIDWESATEDGPPFYDLLHYVVQAHALLGKPDADAIVDGLRGKGWVGKAVNAYADAAGLDRGSARMALIDYLRVSHDNLDPAAANAAAALKVRDSLLKRVEETES